MNFEKAKKVVTVFLVLSCVACVVGLTAFASGSTEANYAGLAAIIFLFLAVGSAFKWCRCPWCGQLLFRRMYKLKVCPACNRDLTTGKKKKGKGGKR